MAKIKKIYDDKLSPENPVEIYPITSTQAVYNTENVTVDALIAEGYRFGGLVEPTDSPALSDTNQRAFYFATKDGIYPNFGNQTVENGRMSIFLWNGSAWGKQSLAVGSANIAGYKVLASVNDLPRQATNLGYLIEDTTLPEGVENQFLYVWVGEGGDTLEGMYQNCGQLRGASAYEVARDNGYEGTQEEWLNDPVNGIKGVGISKWELSQSTADSGVSTITVTLNTGDVETFDVYNGKGIASVEVVGSESSADSATNTYRVTYSDGNHFDFHTKNGKGIASIAIVGSYSDADGATNTYRVTYSDGNHFDFNVKNGNKGDSGYSGAAGELQVVNSLDSSDATAALSAAQGKVLKDLHDTDKNIVNVNDLNGTPTTPYQDADAARIAVSSLSGLRITGQIITYLLADGWHTEQFIGSDVNNWTTASNWLPIAPITVTQNSQTGHTDITIGSETTPVASIGDLDFVKNKINNLCKVFDQGKCISYTDGSVFEIDSGYAVSDYIDVSDIEKIRYQIKGAGSSTCLIAAYNSSKEYVQENSISPTISYYINSGIWTKQSGTQYVRFAFQTDAETSHLAFAESPFFEDDVKSMSQLIANGNINWMFDTSTLNQGLFNTNGTLAYTTGSYPNYKYCPTFFYIKGAKKVLTNGKCSGSQAAIIFYAVNKSTVVGYVQTQTPTLMEYDVPEAAVYMRVCTERYEVTGNILAFAKNIDTLEDYQISELNNNVATVFDTTTLVGNRLLSATTGELTTFSGEADNYKACETYFPVKVGQVIVTNARCTGSTAAICFYNSSKTFISSIQIANISLAGYSVPEGAAYMRVCTERYATTHSLIALSIGNNGNNQMVQFLIDQINNNITDIYSRLASNDSPVKYFDVNKDAWIADEIVKEFTPKQNVISYKHSGTITPQSRFAVWGFDDFRETDFSFIIPLFNKYGAKGEFNKIFQNIIATNSEKSQVNALLRGRHEFGDHTWLHYKYPFDEPLWNGQNPNSPDGNQVPYPLDTDFTQAVDGYKNVFGIDTRWTVDGTNSSIPIHTTWANLSAAECQQIRELFSVMKDTSSNVIAKLDELSNKYLGTSGNSNGSWNGTQYTGGIFTGCKTSANHEIWERYLLVTNMYLKEQFGINYNLQTWSKPGSKASGCYYEYNGKKYYDREHTILVNNLARFASSLYLNNDNTGKLRSWTDVLFEFGYNCTNDAQDPSLVDGQVKPCMSAQFVFNSKGNKPNALIYPNTRNKFMDYAAIATEYTKGTDLTGTEPYEIQMYNDVNSSFHKAVEGWRKVTANGILVGQITDSQDTWSERIIIEALLKYARSAGIKLVTLAEAYDICFNNRIQGGNLLYNPQFRNTAKEFMPTANVPDNPDGFDGQCSVSNTDGEPTLVTTGNTIYDHYGIPCGKLVFSGDVKGSGTITIKAIKNSTPYANIDSADTIKTITIDSASTFDSMEESLLVASNELTAYEQLCAGYGERIIGLRFIFSSGLSIKNLYLGER